MYKKLALFNGVLLAIMIYLNGAFADRMGIYISTLIYHISGLLLLIILSALKRNKLSSLLRVSPIFLLPGILSVMTILFNNITIPRIGVTLASGIALFGQLVMSALVEHFGLFGMPKNRIKKEKILGFIIITIGIIVMILF